MKPKVLVYLLALIIGIVSFAIRQDLSDIAKIIGTTSNSPAIEKSITHSKDLLLASMMLSFVLALGATLKIKKEEHGSTNYKTGID